MKAHLESLVCAGQDRNAKQGIVRKYCQVRALEFLQDADAFHTWVLRGDGALRLLFSLPRCGDDLEFALDPVKEHLPFEKALRRVVRGFHAEAYHVQARTIGLKAVKAGILYFKGLFWELGLSSFPKEEFTIQIELDTSPPTGGLRKTTILRTFETLHLLHFDKATLMAGKVAAVLTSPFLRGQDVFDLAWLQETAPYCRPNLTYLNDSLAQAGWSGSSITAKNWRPAVLKRLKGFRWSRMKEEVAGLLEDPRSHERLLERKAVLGLLRPDTPCDPLPGRPGRKKAARRRGARE